MTFTPNQKQQQQGLRAPNRIILVSVRRLAPQASGVRDQPIESMAHPTKYLSRSRQVKFAVNVGVYYSGPGLCFFGIHIR